MAVYILERKAEPSVLTMPFNTYNEAVSFARSMEQVKAGKPFKRVTTCGNVSWYVSIPAKNPQGAIYRRAA